MKNNILAIFLLLAVFTAYSCNDEKNDVCKNLMCTQEFAFVVIKFEDSNGNAVNVEDYSSVNIRTGKTISTSQSEYPATGGYYVVADDGNISDFSKDGDIVLVSGKHPQTQETKTAELKISGGECACHISKVSGPEKIVFD